jgi:hypothetical protein
MVKIAKSIYYHQHNGEEGISRNSQSPTPGVESSAIGPPFSRGPLPISYFILLPSSMAIPKTAWNP